MTALAVALFVCTAATPVAGACCTVKPAAMTSMHGAMACCSETCKLTKPVPERDRNATITPQASSGDPLSIAGEVTSCDCSTSTIGSSHERHEAPDDSPPPFLLHRQFRI